MTTVSRGDRRHLDGAATVWAQATAARDGDTEVAPLELARPIIADILDRPGSILVVALAADAAVSAFAVAEPRRAQSTVASESTTAEVRYVGVRPDRWGGGLGGAVLSRLCAELELAGFGAAELLVYQDNAAAIRLYERLGWQPSGSPGPHPRTGKLEQRYRLDLSGGAG